MRNVSTIVALAFLITLTSQFGTAFAQSPDFSTSKNKLTLKSLAAQVATLTQTVNTLQTNVTTLQGQLTTANSTITALQTQLNSTNAQNAFALGQFVSVDTKNTIHGLKAPHVFFTGANVHIRSGSGMTMDSTGLGNLLVGYDDDSAALSVGGMSCNSMFVDAHRGGSHNLIVGDCHAFLASGGLVAGFSNIVEAQAASVSGGFGNVADAPASSVSGGSDNVAIATAASVSGGTSNTAIADNASISGGSSNLATAADASVSGGSCNTAGLPEPTLSPCSPDASFPAPSVSGGIQNVASGADASVSGGFFNTAATNGSSVSGGLCNTAGAALAVTGCSENDTDEASVTGGIENLASGGTASVNGGGSNAARGNGSSVGGGQSQIASGTAQNVN